MQIITPTLLVDKEKVLSNIEEIVNMLIKMGLDYDPI